MAKVDILGDKQVVVGRVTKPEIFSQERQRLQSSWVIISLLLVLGLWEGLVRALNASHLILLRLGDCRSMGDV